MERHSRQVLESALLSTCFRDVSFRETKFLECGPEFSVFRSPVRGACMQRRHVATSGLTGFVILLAAVSAENAGSDISFPNEFRKLVCR